MTPEDRKYSKAHEWAMLKDSVVTVGVTEFAVNSLGDVIFIDMPEVGAELTQDEKYGEIESVKTVSDLISPVTGTVVELNEVVAANPEAVNDDPYGNGWIMRVQIADGNELENLIGASEYDAHTAL